MIRAATRQDVPRVCQMAERFLGSSVYADVATPDPEALAELVHVCLNNGRVFLAEVEGVVVGMLAVALFPHPMTGVLMGEELAWWMEPEHRGGILGPRLFAEAERFCQLAGASLFKVVAPRGADQVSAFYARRGYLEVETAWCKALTAQES